MAFVSELIGHTITDQDGVYVGTLKDLIARKTEFAHPVVQAIVVKHRGGTDWVLPYHCVAVLFAPAIALKCSLHDTHPYPPHDSDIYLARDVLDKQIIDTDGARVVRVNDVELVRVNGMVAVSNVDVGVPGILRRLGLGRLSHIARLKGLMPESYISWDDVEILAYDQKMQLKVSRRHLAELHPADVAEILSDMNKLESNRFLESLDVEQLADTLEEVEPEYQASLIEGMTDEKVADVLEEMEPDEAADLLAELPPDRSEDLLALMETDEAEDVRKLLAYPEDSAGGIMTTEFATIHPEMTAGQALAYIRENCPDAETVFYIYVTDEEEHLIGVASLRSLVFAEPGSVVADFMVKRIISVSLDDKQEDIAQLIAKYDLLAVPVVDAEHRIHGIVTADDALDKIIPTAWKKRLPRFFR